ncbi:MAG: stalk domain-containing protein [Bacillota bacterium]|nr:stalk domain-containing protein [Bacillota bacterium]
MKKLYLTILALFFIFLTGCVGPKNQNLSFNGYALQKAPAIESRVGEKLIPAEALTGIAGYKLDYQNKGKTLIINGAGQKIVFYADSDKVNVNGKQGKIGVKSIIEDGKFLVPANFFTALTGGKAEISGQNVRLTGKHGFESKNMKSLKETDICYKAEYEFNYKTALNDESVFKYNVCIPKDYNTSNKYPVILMLSEGESKKESENILLSEMKALGYKAVVIVPELSEGNAWYGEQLKSAGEALSKVINDFRVDENRIYVSGVSDGGSGVWKYAFMYPEKAAAITPINAGRIIDFESSAHLLKNTAIWAFHESNNLKAPAKYDSEKVVFMRNAGNKNIKYSEFQQTIGSISKMVYSDDEYYKWLFSQKLDKTKKTENKELSAEELIGKTVKSMVGLNLKSFKVAENAKVSYTDSGAVVESKDGKNAYISCKAQYQLPMVIKVKASTDSSDLKLFFDDMPITLNWEKDPYEIHVTDFLTNTEYGLQSSDGYIKPGKLSEITWIIGADYMALIVDGEVRLFNQGSLDYMVGGNYKGSAGIGVSGKSHVTVEYFETGSAAPYFK